MTDYTKGPWGVFNHNGTICIDNRGGDGRRPCIVDWPGFDGNEMSRKENEANARLIAAAPEMLEALNAAVSQVHLTNSTEPMSPDVKRVFDQCCAAIAKAEGRSK